MGVAESEANQTLASIFAFTLLSVEVVLKLFPVVLLPISADELVIYPGAMVSIAIVSIATVSIAIVSIAIVSIAIVSIAVVSMAVVSITSPPICPGTNHSAPTTDAGGDKTLSLSNLIIASTYSVVAVGAVVLMRAIQDVDALQQPAANDGPAGDPLLVPLLKRRKFSLYKASAAARLWFSAPPSNP